jgi:hypothetical protein
MVRRRSTVRFRNGAPAQASFSNSCLSADFKIKRLAKAVWVPLAFRWYLEYREALRCMRLSDLGLSDSMP